MNSQFSAQLRNFCSTSPNAFRKNQEWNMDPSRSDRHCEVKGTENWMPGIVFLEPISVEPLCDKTSKKSIFNLKISSIKPTKGRFSSQGQFLSKSTLVTTETNQLTLVFQQPASNSSSENFTEKSTDSSSNRQPNSFPRTIPIFDGILEKFELFEYFLQKTSIFRTNWAKNTKLIYSILSCTVVRCRQSKTLNFSPGSTKNVKLREVTTSTFKFPKLASNSVHLIFLMCF